MARNRIHRIEIFLPLTAAGTDEERFAPVMLPFSKGYIIAASLTPDEAVAAHASNFTDLSLKKGGTALGSHSTDSAADGALTKATPVDLTLSGSGLLVADGEVLEFDKVDSGTGAAFQGTLSVLVEERPYP